MAAKNAKTSPVAMRSSCSVMAYLLQGIAHPCGSNVVDRDQKGRSGIRVGGATWRERHGHRVSIIGERARA